MAEYIVQKPIDLTKLTAKARKQLDAIPYFDITPKYDGCCAVLLFDDNGSFAGAYSATGERVRSMEHIGRHLQDKWGLRNTALIGEAWIPGAEFPVISGAFRRHGANVALRFVPFDAVRWDAGCAELRDGRPYRERMDTLLQGYDPEFVIPVVHHMGSLADADDIARKYKAEGGYDGAIARVLDAPYAVGRCKFEVVKVKPVLSLDLRVVSHAIEPGEKTGRAVVTICVDYKGVESWVGSGVPHNIDTNELRLGAIVEVECMGLTPDGKLREPRFKGIRHDKLEVDA